MDTDSQSENSSASNESCTSSDNNTFHDNDEDSNDSSSLEIRDDVDEVEERQEKFKSVESDWARDERCKTKINQGEFGTEYSNTGEIPCLNTDLNIVKLIKVGARLADSSDSEFELDNDISNDKFNCSVSTVLNNGCQQSTEAVEIFKEIDDGIQFQVKTDNDFISEAIVAKSAPNVKVEGLAVSLNDIAMSLPIENQIPKAEFNKNVDIESARESVEYFYSAQSLLEYAPLLSCQSKTPGVESGYFEKSETELSEEENNAATSGKIRRIKTRTHSKTDSTISEDLRKDLNRFIAMINTLEKGNSNSNVEGKQHTFEPTLSIEGHLGNEDLSTGSFEKTEKGQEIKNKITERGYWSTVFGQASQVEAREELTLDERLSGIKKAHRALELLEDYHARLSEPQDRALRTAIDRVIRIFKSRLFQALLARNFMQAYRYQSQCVQAVVKLLQQLKEENWCLPVMYTTCLDLRILAQKCEELGSGSKPGEILEKAADCLMSCFRVCAADNRSSDEDTKRLGMLNLVNQLFKVYFRINKLHLCKPLIRAIDSSSFKDYFPLPEQITYKYFVGRKAMFDSDYKSADEFLSFALKNCPRNFPHNKRLILIYLVPVKMLLGYMPKKEILERFDILQFHELAVALKEGNVRKFDEVMQRHEIFFIKCGIYLLVEKLKFIVYRNLFKKVYLIRQTHQLDLPDFRAALQFVGETDMSIDETHCIVANLIYEGKIKGYISHSHNKLVVSKQNPFPPLNTVS